MEKKKEKLRELLQMKEEEKEELVKDVESRFNEIANMLFQDFHIEKEGVRYDFLEVEFYFYSEEHPDFITYPRNTKAGEWFFHMSGVDISFESKEEGEGKEVTVFGGILVRSILKGEKTPIVGPYKCVDELFDKFDALGDELKNFPILKPNEKKQEGIKVRSCVRWIPPFTNAEKSDKEKEKIKRKEKELSVRYSEFESKKFEEFILKEYRYYRNCDCFMKMPGYYPAKPKLEQN